MPSTRKILGIAIISTGIGVALIAVLAALLRRKKKTSASRPDVLNEALAHPLDLALHGERIHQSTLNQTYTIF